MILTVIVPAYRVENYIEKTLRSVLDLADDSIEIIVVNDGSTDHTQEIIETVFKTYLHAHKTLINQVNQGVSVARNVGLSHAKGEYVLFLDGDDFVDPLFLSTLTPILKTSFDVLVYGYADITEEGTTLRTRQNKVMLEKDDLEEGAAWLKGLLEDTHYAWTGCVVYNRNFLLKHAITFTPGCRNGEDQEFFYRVFARAKTIKSIPDVLSYYLERQSSISNTLNIHRLDAVEAFIRGMEDAQVVLSQNNQALDETLINRTLIDSYFYNFNALLRLIAKNKSLKLNELFSNIKDTYPTLIPQVHHIMAQTKHPTFRAFLRAKLHKLSPTLYARLYVFMMRLARR